MKQSILNGRLARRIGIYVILTSTIITLFSSGIQIYFEFQRDKKETLDNFDLIEQTNLSTISSRVWHVDTNELKIEISQLIELPSMQYIAIFEDGTMLMEVGNKINDNNIVTKVFPLTRSEHGNIYQIGTLVAQISLKDAYQRNINRAIVIIFSNMLKTIIVATFILFIFYKLVARHLFKIAAYADKTNFDSPEETIILDRKENKPGMMDELDVLLISFRRMQRKVYSEIKATAKREQDLLDTLDSIGYGVITADINGKVTRMNPIAEQLTGWSINEALNKPLEDVFHLVNTSTNKRISNPIGTILESGSDIYKNDHTTLISKTNKKYQISHSTAPIKSDEEIIGVVFVFNDITEQYEMSHELAYKEQEHRETLQSMVDAVITIDEKGIIQTFNRAAEDLFGYLEKNILGENVKSIMPEPFSSSHDQYLENYVQTGTKKLIGQNREVVGLRKDQSTFPMRLSVAELPKNPDGKRRFIGSCIDLSLYKEQEEKIRRAQKMDALGKLTGGIAHDYNNMLAVILGYTAMLKEQLGEHPKLKTYAEEIFHAGQRGAKLTHKLLSFSRNKNSTAKKVNINNVLLESQNMLEKTLTVQIKFTLKLQDDLWPVFIDGNDFEDAILNMSINAMHAMNNEGQLTIQTSNKVLNANEGAQLELEPGKYVLLSMIDTGCGMDDITKENLFDPFYSTKGEQGTGLGLSQVYGFVEQSGGAITVDSQINSGTHFTLYFPCFSGKIENKDNINNQKNTNLTGNETILVVDDEPALVNLTADILRNNHYKVYCAGNAAAALEKLDTTSIDLLITDIIMPDMDGYKLATRVNDKYPGTKILFTSGYSNNKVPSMIDSSLKNNSIAKPYNPEELLLKIREVFAEE